MGTLQAHMGEYTYIVYEHTSHINRPCNGHLHKTSTPTCILYPFAVISLYAVVHKYATDCVEGSLCKHPRLGTALWARDPTEEMQLVCVGISCTLM